MLRKMLNEFRGKKRTEGHEKPALIQSETASADRAVDGRIKMTRRSFMEALGVCAATVFAPSMVAGCETDYIFNPDDFYGNFRFSDYPRLDPREVKEWDESVKYSIPDVIVALNQSISEDMALTLDVAKLFDIKFSDDKIVVRLKSEDPAELNNLLAGTGILVTDLRVIGTTFELELADQNGNVGKFMHMGYYLSFEGTAADGSDGIVYLSERNDGRGVICLSGKLQPQPNDNKSFYYQANKARCISPAGEVLVADWRANTGFYKSSDQAKGFNVADKDSLMRFLDAAKCGVNCRMFFDRVSCTDAGPVGFVDTHDFDMSKLTTMDDLIEIIKDLPRSPEIFAGFIDSCIDYRANAEKSKTDSFKHPLESFRSKLADCDDYAVLNYFWAYLQNYNPNLIVLLEGEKDAHIFIWYRDEQDKLVVMDNVKVTTWPKETKIEDYVGEEWPGMEIILNQPM